MPFSFTQFCAFNSKKKAWCPRWPAVGILDLKQECLLLRFTFTTLPGRFGSTSCNLDSKVPFYSFELKCFLLLLDLELCQFFLCNCVQVSEIH